jgi:hypothetical protein
VENIIARVYLETTMFSFYHEERQASEYQRRKAQARDVLAFLRAGKFEIYTSDYAVIEMEHTKKNGKICCDLLGITALLFYNAMKKPSV